MNRIHQVGDKVAYFCVPMRNKDRVPEDYGGDTAATRYYVGIIERERTEYDLQGDWVIQPISRVTGKPFDNMVDVRYEWELQFVQEAMCRS
jgi:hypothetical protein